MYGSRKKRRSGLLYKEIVCDRGSYYYCKLSDSICVDETGYNVRWNGKSKCRYVLPYGDVDHNYKTICLGSVIYSGIWFTCSRRREVFNDYILHYDVGMQILSLCILNPSYGIWTDWSLDRYVCGLDCSWNYIYMEIS